MLCRPSKDYQNSRPINNRYSNNNSSNNIINEEDRDIKNFKQRKVKATHHKNNPYNNKSHINTNRNKINNNKNKIQIQTFNINLEVLKERK